MILRRKKTVFIIIALIIMFSVGCSKNTAAEGNDGDDKSSGNPPGLVTFIELGSVNCIPCVAMQPIMEQVREDYPGRVEVVFHDVWTDEGKPYAREFGIRAIPTQVFLDREGNEYFRHVGFFPKEELYKVLEQGLEMK